MSGQNARLQALLRKRDPHIIWTHCMLHRQAYGSRGATDYISMTGRLKNLCDDMETEHVALLHYCETCWLFPDKALHSAFELKEEVAIFLGDMKNNYNANLCYNKNFIQKMTYQVDISEN
jgi:hypothetical protein